MAVNHQSAKGTRAVAEKEIKNRSLLPNALAEEKLESTVTHLQTYGRSQNPSYCSLPGTNNRSVTKPSDS